MTISNRWLCLVCFALVYEATAQHSRSKAEQQPYSLELTTKFHTTGHSPYTGIYLNHHLNTELGLSYKYKQFGAFINKNVDFQDFRSPINFTTMGVFRSFQLGESLKLTPYLGYFLRQSYSIMDESSDMWTCLIVTLTINRWIIIENATLVGNLIRHSHSVAMANRINIALWVKRFRIDVYTWYNCAVNRIPHFATASLAVTSPELVITHSISAKVQAALVQQIAGEMPENVMSRAGLFSLIIPVDLSRK